MKGTLSDYLALTKPGILVFLLITGFAGMVVAGRGLPPPGIALAGLFGLALSCGGAAAVNMWYDRDIDQIMTRTRERPVAAGRVPPVAALIFGLVLEVASLVVLGVFVNLLAALLALAGYVYYVGIYTMWLKRRTAQNIVIGGGAGAFPPIVGWAAITGHLAVAPLLMFAIVFLWTPPHFWSLALYKQDDYRAANIPMMPVVAGDRSTKVQSLVYAILLVLATVALWLTGSVGTLYLVVALVLGLAFIVESCLLLLEPRSETHRARQTFRFSLLYLIGIFVAMMVSLPPH